MYIWESVEETQYMDSTGAESTVGLYYDMLHVERTWEGWHGFLLAYVPPSAHWDYYDAGGLATVDEELFKTQEQAMLWCEQRDTSRYTKENKDEDDGHI